MLQYTSTVFQHPQLLCSQHFCGASYGLFRQRGFFSSTRRAPGGVTWTKPHDGYLLVNIQKTLENRHLSKVNQLWMCHVYPFSIAMLNYQRVELLTVRHPNMFTPTSRSGRAVRTDCFDSADFFPQPGELLVVWHEPSLQWIACLQCVCVSITWTMFVEQLPSVLRCWIQKCCPICRLGVPDAIVTCCW